MGLFGKAKQEAMAANDRLRDKQIEMARLGRAGKRGGSEYNAANRECERLEARIRQLRNQ